MLARMELQALSAEAMQLRQHFAAAAERAGRREWSREEVMQGFVVDVGDLTKLVMARAGLRTVDGLDEKLAHELADCLWSVLVLSRLYDVDLEKAFCTMVEDATRKLTAAGRETT